MKQAATPTRRIAVVGLGYVGLPAALAFAEHFSVIAFDSNPARVQALQRGEDASHEQTTAALQHTSAVFTADPERLRQADFFIVAVPTPIDDAHRPDLSLLEQVSLLVGRYLKPGDIVVYESTVYPGATEEVCLPLLAKASGLQPGKDFFLAYSPERINPGDSVHSFTQVTKIVAAQQPEILALVAQVYQTVITPGVYQASSIKVAEAAKIIENTQRDVNIALMNEFAIICNHLGIDTRQVLAAASTKWNFADFQPGLVGGHCIDVDPYYLSFQAERYGYKPQVILASRSVNDGMSEYLTQQIVKYLLQQGVNLQGARLGVMGITFKENCADIRNSKVAELVQHLASYGIQCLLHDPYADPVAVKTHYGLSLSTWEQITALDGLILAVAHHQYQSIPLANWVALFKVKPVVVDIKGLLDPVACHAQGVQVWRL